MAPTENQPQTRSHEQWLKPVVRSLLARLCALGLPGRYLMVELISPYLLPSNSTAQKITSDFVLPCDLRDLIQRQIYYGLYEPEETRLFSKLLQPGDVVLDLGANIGYYTLLAAARVGTTGEVHAFEPVPENFLTLQANVQRNGWKNVIIQQLAVADGASENLTLYTREGAHNSGWASLARSLKYQNVPMEVAAITIDRYITERGLPHIALIKLDIEGAEPFALRGAATLLSSKSGPKVLCEINPFLLRQANSSPEELKGILTNYGYDLYEITQRGLLRIDDKRPESRLMNILATKTL